MMRVRLHNGTVVEYATANYVKRHAEFSDLLTQELGTCLAQVPNSAMIEIRRPSRVIGGPTTSPDEAAMIVRDAIRNVSDRHLATIKKQLRDFDARSYQWTDE